MSGPDPEPMEKRALIAFALSALVLLVWYWFFSPAPTPPPRKEVPAAAAPAPEQPSAAAPAAAPAAQAAPAQAAVPIAAEKTEEITIDTDLFHVVLTNKGGRVVSWKLKAYKDAAGNPLEVVPSIAARADTLPLAVDLDDRTLADEINGALFRVEKTAGASGDGKTPGQTIRFTWADGKGLQVRKSLSFQEASYLVGLDLQVDDRGRRVPARVCWGPGFEARGAEEATSQIHYAGYAVRNVGGVVTRLTKTKQDVALLGLQDLRWAGLDEQFFAALILPSGSKGDLIIRPVQVAPPKSPAAAPGASEPKPQSLLVVAVNVPEGGATMFVGPKKYTLLTALDRDLASVVWFSSYSLIYPFAKYLFLALLWLHGHLVPNYGLAIIVATIVLRLIFFPLNQYSMVSMRKMQKQMQRIQPKVNAIKAKHKKSRDPQARAKMNEEMMALYKKEGVNPMGSMSGCLPMLIQFPILIAFYNVLTVAVELRSAPFFGWITDLTAKDPLYITPLLMGATMFLQQKMTSTPGGDPMQQRMMMMMPVVFTLMFLNLPSGLVLYWLVNNVLGIGQQWLVNRHIGRLEAAAQKA